MAVECKSVRFARLGVNGGVGEGRRTSVNTNEHNGTTLFNTQVDVHPRLHAESDQTNAAAEGLVSAGDGSKHHLKHLSAPHPINFLKLLLRYC